MKNYGRIRGAIVPPEIDITPSYVYLASNITEYEEDFDGNIISGYEYDYVAYTKDEYILKIAEENAVLADELKATKILLGVE